VAESPGEVRLAAARERLREAAEAGADELALVALRAEVEVAERDLSEASRQAAFLARLERMIGSRTWGPGEPTGGRCRLCGEPDVFDPDMRIVHGGGGCKGPRSTAVAKPTEILRPRRTGGWYDDDDDE
jgi:hypothetical protein